MYSIVSRFSLPNLRFFSLFFQTSAINGHCNISHHLCLVHSLSTSITISGPLGSITQSVCIIKFHSTSALLLSLCYMIKPDLCKYSSARITSAKDSRPYTTSRNISSGLGCNASSIVTNFLVFLVIFRTSSSLFQFSITPVYSSSGFALLHYHKSMCIDVAS